MFSYAEPEATSGALAALQGLELGEHTTLAFQRIAPAMAEALFDEGGDEGAAAAAAAAAAVGPGGGGAAAALAIAAGAAAGRAEADGTAGGAVSPGLASSSVLRLDCMVGEADLASANDVAEIEEDVREESGRFGAVVSVLVPPLGAPGCGAVFVEFEAEEAAGRARRVMDNRAFGDGKVRAVFFDAALYHAGDLGKPLFAAPEAAPEAAPPAAPVPVAPHAPAPAAWSGVAMEDEDEEAAEEEEAEAPPPPPVAADDLD